MRDFESQRVTVTLSRGLLKQIDRLAAHGLTSRSGLVRQAVLDYVRLPANRLIAEPESVDSDKMYEYIKKDHPYLSPRDTELVRFFYGQKIESKE